MDEPNDEGLMRTLLAAHDAGDEAASHRAFEELYRRHEGAAYSLALHLTGSPEQAEEVHQRAMIRVWKYLRSYDPAKGTVRSWLLRIVARTSLTASAERRRHSVETDLGTVQAQAARIGPAERPEQAAAQMEVRATLRGMLERLPAPERRMLALYYGGGLSQEEIASQLAMPKRTVSHRIQRALEQLRADLERRGLAAGLPLLGAEGLGELFTAGGSPPPQAASQIMAQALRTPIDPAGAALEASRRIAGAPGQSAGAWAAAVLAAACVAAGGAWYVQQQSSGPSAAASKEEGAPAEPAVAKTRANGDTAPAGPAPAPGKASAGLPAHWDFEKERGAGLRVVSGTWDWMTDPMRKTGCMIPTGVEGVVIEPQVALPPGPVRVRLRYRMAKAGNLKFACYLMGAEAAFVPHQVWRDPVDMPALGHDEFMRVRTMDHYLFDRYLVSVNDGAPWCVRVYERPYASERFALILMNTAVFEIDIQAVAPQDLPSATRDMTKLIAGLAQGPVQVRADGTQVPPGAKDSLPHP